MVKQYAKNLILRQFRILKTYDGYFFKHFFHPLLRKKGRERKNLSCLSQSGSLSRYLVTHLAGQTIPFVSETSRVVQKTQFYFFSGIYYLVLLFIVAKHNFWANLTICKNLCLLYECFREITIIAFVLPFCLLFFMMCFTVQANGL